MHFDEQPPGLHPAPDPRLQERMSDAERATVIGVVLVLLALLALSVVMG